ncbi:hypothetical protein E2C01_018747 [Portunus trituberculatus]|uniref:Uncharacterized protein n=1 Tax=Portunus trituberculatus TaxID=210409 RepID=A0A5B7DXC4_PORTR|nr:hypothetical protein [Portunus trituberculatus]
MVIVKSLNSASYLIISIRVFNVLSDELHSLNRLLDFWGVGSLAVNVTPAQVCEGETKRGVRASG